MTYAADTTVSVERSRAELERTLVRYGADSFTYGWEDGKAAVAFRVDGRYVRFLMAVPAREEFATSPSGRARTAAAAEKAWEQASRARWRALNDTGKMPSLLPAARKSLGSGRR